MTTMTIRCFVSAFSKSIPSVARYLSEMPGVEAVYLLTNGDESETGSFKTLPLEAPVCHVSSLRRMALESGDGYLLLLMPEVLIEPAENLCCRMRAVAQDTGAAMLYADSWRADDDDSRRVNRRIDWHEGSLRDDFDFGPVLFFRAADFRAVVEQITEKYAYAAFYDLWLRLSRQGKIFHLREMLYTERPIGKLPGERQFDYVNPRNREVQIEMEHAFTCHLQAIGACLPEITRRISFADGIFPVEVSVVIPVYNRVQTVGDAVQSALAQQTDFEFNVLVVDNHSTDGTTALLRSLAEKNPSLHHLVPPSTDLEIGGCWNYAVSSPQCGRFVVQLDSDDLYKSPDVLSHIVDVFRQEGCAMVVGSYELVDWRLQPLPPGLIDHREWSNANGHNNALRINGLGAPRAFYTPLLRENPFPNVSYGEDYAVGLRFSREYRVGRIYDSLYLCRRWPGNSDAGIDIEQLNRNNAYKDHLRAIELVARKQLLHEYLQ